MKSYCGLIFFCTDSTKAGIFTRRMSGRLCLSTAMYVVWPLLKNKVGSNEILGIILDPWRTRVVGKIQLFA